MMDHPLFGTKSLIAAMLGSVLTLSACEERDVYLAGEREDIRSVLQDPDLAAPQVAKVTAENRSVPISLGSGAANPNISASPQLVWSAKIGDGDSRRGRITADPVVAGSRVFTLDAGAQVVATSLSGEPLWLRDLTPPNDRAGQGTGGGMAVDGDTLYVSVGFGLLSALDVTTGATRWTHDFEATGSGTPTVYGDLVYITSGDDTGWALRKSDGRVEWQAGSTASRRNVLGAPAPVVTNQFAIFGYGSGEVRAFFRRGGLPRWDSAVLGKRPGRALSSIVDLSSAPVLAGGQLFAGNLSGRLVALDPESGSRNWTANEGAVGPVAYAGGNIFAVTDRNELVRLDASDGSRIWGVELPNFSNKRPRRQSQVVTHNGPIIAGGRLLLASNDGLLRSFDPRDGSLIGSVEIPHGATTAPVISGGVLYVVSSKGQLHAFR